METSEQETRPIYKSIPRTLMSFDVIGMTNVSGMERKLELLTESPPLKTAYVIFDAFRCSSTLLACFAAGIAGAFVKEKVVTQGGVDIETARRIANELGKKLILGGELNGKPVPNGAIGNSPIDAIHQDIEGCILHFQSTNFGRLFARISEFTEPRLDHSDVFVLGVQNIGVTASLIKSKEYARIVVAAAGFFECCALEDMVVGGAFLTTIGYPLIKMDDDALAMLAAYRTFGLESEILSRCWTSRVLEELSKFDDIFDILEGRRFPHHHMKVMSETILQVYRLKGFPFIAKALQFAE